MATKAGGLGRPFKLEESFKNLLFLNGYWLFLNGQRFEPDSPELAAISPFSEGLMMPKLALMRKNQYPKVEMSLPSLAENAGRLAEVEHEVQLMKQDPSKLDTLDIFRASASLATLRPAEVHSRALVQGGAVLGKPSPLPTPTIWKVTPNVA